MTQQQHYPTLVNQPVTSIIKGVDRDLERGEDIIMLGYGLVMMAPIFAPVAPPQILLPLMALAFLVSVCMARNHFHKIQKRILASMDLQQDKDFSPLTPIFEVFAEHPKHTLTDSFNPLKNIQRTIKSVLGALMINPFWMPIFYVLGMQFAEEKHLQALNKAVIKLERIYIP
jgi:hypothetical protein